MEKFCHNCNRENAEDHNDTYDKCDAWMSNYSDESSLVDCHWHEILKLREKVANLEKENTELRFLKNGSIGKKRK